jgi:cytoskeleton protein RodZ
MTLTPMYLLKTPGNHTIEISQDQLRSLLGEIEAELHRSQVYRRVLATLHKMLGSSAEQAKILVKAVSREAIALAFQQFAQQRQQVTDVSQQTEVTNVSPKLEPENTNELLQCLTSVKLHPKPAAVNTSEDSLSSQTKLVANKLTNSVISPEKKSPTAIQIRGLNLKKKSSHTKLTKQIAAERRLETIRHIGQQLQQARESKGMSLSQLKIYTHIPINQMEALENGNLELLPEDAVVRGFIRIMANALGLNGSALAASLPAPDTVKSVLPSWYQSKNSTGSLVLDINPISLYLGYATLVAGAVSGLSLMSQQANSDQTRQTDPDIQPSSSLSQSAEKTKATVKPGIKSSNTGIVVGPDISPPEAL